MQVNKLIGDQKMKKILVFVLLVVGLSMAADSYVVETEVLSFANETAAKLDTLASGDSAFCVIYQGTETRGVPAKISLFLPDVLASGDSAQVYVRELASATTGRTRTLGVNKTSLNDISGFSASDNVRAPNSTGTDVYKSHLLGNYYYGNGPQGKGATVLTYSPADSVHAARVEFVFVETAGAPIVTGMDTLATSKIFLEKLYLK